MEITNSEYKYLKSQIELLTTQNEELVAEKQALELQLLALDMKDNTKDKTKKILKEAVLAKNMYQKSLNELKEKTKQANELIKELKLIRKKEASKFIKAVDSAISKIEH